MLNILFLILPLAIVDSLNPFTVAIHVFLLTTKNPLPKAIFHIIGIYLMYLIGGVLIFLGLDLVIREFLSIPNIQLIRYIVGFLLGIGIIFFGYKKYKAGFHETNISKNIPINPIYCLFLGFFSTIGDIPTAFPFFIALGIVKNMGFNTLDANTIIALLFYVFIYVLPLIILTSLLAFRQSSSLLWKIGSYIDRWSHKLIIWTSILIGALLLIDSIFFFAGLIV